MAKKTKTLTEPIKVTVSMVKNPEWTKQFAVVQRELKKLSKIHVGTFISK